MRLMNNREWTAAAVEYREKNDILMSSPSMYQMPASEFYRLMFRNHMEHKGEPADYGEDGGGKPNGIALFVGDRGKRTEFFFDDYESIDDMASRARRKMDSLFIAPLGYYGKSKDGQSARYCFGLVVDLDGVKPKNLRNLIAAFDARKRDVEHGIEHPLPQPSAIVNSGTGVHVYYFFEEPVELNYDSRRYLQQMKRMLTDRVWNDATSSLGASERQQLSLYQQYRVPDSTTKVTQNMSDEKFGEHVSHECVAYCYQPAGKQWYVTPEHIRDCLVVAGCSVDDMQKLETYRTGADRTPLEEAKKLWPDWYESVINGNKRSPRWIVKRDLYDWWLRKLRNEKVARVGTRYNCILALAIFGVKCAIPFDEVESDAHSLVNDFNELGMASNAKFTMRDADDALKIYFVPYAHTITRQFISDKTKVEMKPSKRNGRNRVEHGKYVYQLLKERGIELKPTRHRKLYRDEIRQIAYEHPEMTKCAIAEQLNINPSTVSIHTKDGWLDEWYDHLVDEVGRDEADALRQKRADKISEIESNNESSKLTASKIAAYAYANPYSLQKDLAEHFGVSAPTIRNTLSKASISEAVDVYAVSIGASDDEIAEWHDKHDGYISKIKHRGGCADEIREYVERHPDTNVNELCDEFGLTKNGVRYHLHNLGLMDQVRAYQLYGKDEESARWRVREYARTHKGLTVRQIAEELDMNVNTAANYLRPGWQKEHANEKRRRTRMLKKLKKQEEKEALEREIGDEMCQGRDCSTCAHLDRCVEIAEERKAAEGESGGDGDAAVDDTANDATKNHAEKHQKRRGGDGNGNSDKRTGNGSKAARKPHRRSESGNRTNANQKNGNGTSNDARNVAAMNGADDDTSISGMRQTNGRRRVRQSNCMCNEIRRLAYAKPTMTRKQIAKQLSVSVSTVDKWLKPGWIGEFEDELSRSTNLFDVSLLRRDRARASTLVRMGETCRRIREYAYEHLDENKKTISDILDIPYRTVQRWLGDGWQDEWGEYLRCMQPAT